MKSNKAYKEKMSLFFVTTVFFFSTMVLVFSPTTYGQESAIQQSESTSVASKATNVSLKSTDSCKESLGANDLAKAKAYSKDRLDKRLNSTKVIEKSINTTYDGIDSTYKTKMSSIQSIINKYAKGSKAKVNKEDLSKAKPKMLKQTVETRKIIEKGIEGAQSGQTPQVVAGFTCDAIFQGAVYSKLVPNVRAQLKLDAIKMRNSLNQGRYTAINALYKENGSSLKSEKSGIDKLQNPKSYDNDIEALQSRINSGDNVVKDVTSFGAIPKKSAPEITKQLSELTAKLREEKQATSSENNSSGQNSGSGGGTNAPNKVIDKVTKRSTDGKATSGRYCHPHGSDNGHSCVSYGDGKKSTTRKQAVDRARSEAKKHDDDYADSRTISARNPTANNSNSKNSINGNLKAIANQKRAERKAAEKKRAERTKAEVKRKQQQARDRRQYQKEQEQKRQKEKKQYEKDTKKVI